MRYSLLLVLLGATCFASVASHGSKSQNADPGQLEWRASGGHAWDKVGGVVFQGVKIEGNAPSQYEQAVDLVTGFSRSAQQSSSATFLTGFDGFGWCAGNGIVTVIDLPPLVADARSQAFVDRSGWRSQSGSFSKHSNAAAGTSLYVPEGGSEVKVSFDPKTHLVSQVVIETESGPLVTTYSDWRSVGKLKFAFRREQRDNTGEVTIFQFDRAQVLNHVSVSLLQRPKPVPHGRLNGEAIAIVPFRFAGSHIRVDASVNGAKTDLIFDTGAANYFSPEAARRFGLKVIGGINLSGVGESSTTGGFALAKSVSIGAAELDDEMVVVAPTPFGGKPGVPDGLAGYEFLSEFRTAIDYSAKTITFSKFDGPLTEGTRVPFYSDGHSIYISIDVDGHEGLFRLDTGDGSTITLFPNFAKLHDLYQSVTSSMTAGGGVGGVTSVRPITLSNLVLAGAHFTDLPARLSQMKTGAFAERSIAGNLGGGLLRCFRLTFDYEARMVGFETDPKRREECAAGLTK
jgi:aspartyl protease